jgi:hypothetical protein
MRHFLNDIEITPRNRTEIGVISDFSDNPEILSINVDSLILPREAYDIVKQHIQTVGLFEGIPYRVEMASGISLEYYVDLTENPIFRNFECELKIKRRLATDSFFDRANGTSFELMAKKGINFTVFDIPYVIVPDDQVILALITAVTLFSMTQALIQAIKDLSTTISQGIQATTPSVSLAGPVPDIGDIIAFALNVAAQVIYVAGLLLATVNLATKLFELIFPKVRKFKGSLLNTLLTQACGYLGYDFQSTLLSLPYTYLPVPLIKNRKSIWDYLPDALSNDYFNKGYPSSSDTTPTIGQLISALEDTFNARTKVVNGVVYFERRDYWQNITTNNMQPAMVLQSDRDDQFTYNMEEMWKRYYIHFQLDPMDFHTMDTIYDYHNAEFSCEPVNVVNSDLVNIKGLNDVNVPFALGARKNRLTVTEKLVKGLFQVIDALTGVFGGGTNFAASIDARIGVLMISQEYFGVTKLMYTIGGKQPANYLQLLSGSALWYNYHYINEMQLNGWKIKSDVRVRIMESDFVNLLDNNYAEIDGLMCEILRLECIDERSFAQITYRIPDQFAVGKVSTLVID